MREGFTKNTYSNALDCTVQQIRGGTTSNKEEKIFYHIVEIIRNVITQYEFILMDCFHYDYQDKAVQNQMFDNTFILISTHCTMSEFFTVKISTCDN